MIFKDKIARAIAFINKIARAIAFKNKSNITNNTTQIASDSLSLSGFAIDVKNPPSPLAKCLGNKNDDTNAIQALIAYCVANPPYKLYFPPDYYGITSIIIPRGVLLEGVFCTSYEVTSNNRGTVFFDLAPSSSITPIVTFYTPDGHMAGGGLQGVTLLGNTFGHDGLCLNSCGLDMILRDVCILRFGGSGIIGVNVYDMNWYNVSILYCGGFVNSVLHYAVHLDGSVNDSSNAIHIFALHLEQCRYYLYLGRVRHCQFIASKFEQNITNTDLVNPAICISGYSYENEFIACMFPIQSLESWLTANVGKLATDIPYFITGNNSTVIENNVTKFIGCDFTSVTNGTKVIQSNVSNMIIDDCKFDYVTGKDYGLDLTGCKLIHCTIGVLAVSDGFLQGIKVTNCIVADNDIYTINRGSFTPVNDTGITNSNSIIHDNIITGFTIKVKQITPMSIAKDFNSNNINDVIMTSIFGVTSADYLALTLDISKYFSKIFYFNLGSAISLLNITNGFNGEEIIIWNNSASTVKLKASGGNIHITSNDIILNGGDFAKLIFIGSSWHVTSLIKN